MSLETYKQKRNFKKTPEPKGKRKSSKTHIFVVQKHDASHLHYDFRLEIDGVLKSWAVPKGPSLDPSNKRLSIETEDHPMDYGNFEGIIPEGNYGAGTVMVWDKGNFKNITEKDEKPITSKQAYEKGHIKFILKGKKLKGEFSLVNFKGKNWLLIKEKDVFASKKDILKDSKSAKSGKTLEQIKKT